MKRNSSSTLLHLLLAASLVSCTGAEGGSEAGNPTAIRSVTGTLAEDTNTVSASSLATCPATRVVATDAADQTIDSPILSGCTFDLRVFTEKAYSVSFENKGQFVASLLFKTSPLTLPTSVLLVSRGPRPIDLGKITITGRTATPEKDPSTQTDQDGDGVTDFDDDDDDNDEVRDEEETDDDLDGFLDDHEEPTTSPADEAEDTQADAPEGDDHEDEGEGTVASAEVKEVSPRNNETFVDLGREVNVRLSCEVDRNSVTVETFTISTSGHQVACEFDFSGSQTGTEFHCDHENDSFLPERTYTATVRGLKCRDGRSVTSASWSWVTNHEHHEH